MLQPRKKQVLDQEIHYYQFLKALASHSGGKSSSIAYGHSFT